MPNVYNCDLNHGEQIRFHIVGVLKQNYCYKCANDMLAIHYLPKEIYENGNKVCIKAFALNFIDAKRFIIVP